MEDKKKKKKKKAEARQMGTGANLYIRYEVPSRSYDDLPGWNGTEWS
jgi:hypothetical protein